MDKTRRQKEGSLRCSPGAVLLIVSITCLVAGFLAGRTYGGKKIVADAEAIGRGIVVEASSMVNEAGAMMLKQAADSVANLALITGMQDWVGKTDPMCTNTCKKANNGICDDGRGNLTAANQETPLRVFCDLGTDCNDCGPWLTSLKPTWVTRNEEGPISLLAQKGVEVRVKQVHPTLANQVPFRFAYTDPSKDVDISQSMEHTSMVEPVITKIFFKIFQGGCLKANGSRAVFADVGGNFGWFSVLGAAMGCRVIAFEPVPHFRAFLEYNLHLNNLQHLVEVKPNVVSNVHMKPMKMVVPSSGIWGTAGIDGLNIDKNIPGTTEEILVQSLTLNNVIQEDLLLLKVDVEGWEWSVMKGAEEMLKNYNVQNIVMEYSPGTTSSGLRVMEYCPCTASSGMRVMEYSPCTIRSGMHVMEYSPGTVRSGMHVMEYSPCTIRSGMHVMEYCPCTIRSGMHVMEYSPGYY
ncbi:hypothetical protein CEUSTIGMA_g13019.t1 [Chlamydomonas eustigma]|uniref:Methyltransferase FkbM domain-containing protein n=1 Tax=Chlamydomonas eustigma TaxID=1157962 RepID=A0A250XRC4_9CHLO|nr:hypothetical protein CEUSTIGMA_g13019.t1 [Chlamydomonas eustigma]|eukprot:GAX85604.1 hypothetical protein CEUSTIGMA_g13019.t1 [Chlamydomonas eustigma]